MPAQTVKVEGLKDLEKSLVQLREDFDLKRATAKNVVKRAIIDAAEPLKDEWIAKAPDDPATGGDDLRSSIGISTKLSSRQKRLNVKGSELEVYVGAGALPQAHLQEFGTAHHAAQPSARPAWDGNKDGVLKRITSSLEKEIAKAAQRLERKAARLLAKMKTG